MFFLMSFAIATVLAVVLHGTTRRFVRNRLRYVDAVQKGLAPWAAGRGGGLWRGRRCPGH
jgi:hypothetical protein